jgi:hypothetical protein
MIEPIFSEWALKFGLKVFRAEDRPDRWRWSENDIAHPRRLRYVFTTRNGSWDPSNAPGSIPQWARDKFLYPQADPRCNLEGGGNRHLFGLLLGTADEQLPQAGFWFWSDGFRKLELKNDALATFLTALDAKPSGWANNPMDRSSAYDLGRGEKGPWCWCPVGFADVLVGGGLPNQEDISTFGVWQVTDLQVTPPPPPPPSGWETVLTRLDTVDQALASLSQRVTRLEAHNDSWVENLRAIDES